MTLKIEIKGEEFILHPCGAVFWPKRGWLMIADVHLGKVSHFRKAGIAVPEQSISKNFVRLASVSDYFKPSKIIFLGDLFHSAINNEWELFTQWFDGCECGIVLVAGNHDIISPVRYMNLGVEVVSEIAIEEFFLTHHPTEREDMYNFSGHIHPSVRLTGLGRQAVKLPCFFRRENQMILPAFGEFTGTYEMKPAEGEIVYVMLKDSVMMIS